MAKNFSIMKWRLFYLETSYSWFYVTYSNIVNIIKYWNLKTNYSSRCYVTYSAMFFSNILDKEWLIFLALIYRIKISPSKYLHATNTLYYDLLIFPFQGWWWPLPSRIVTFTIASHSSSSRLLEHRRGN